MCNFLLFEYYGKISDIEQTVLKEGSTVKLLDAMWNFYNSERMFLVKTMRYVLEQKFVANKNSHVYVDYVNRMTIKKCRDSLYDQLEYLICEITVKNSAVCIDTADWIRRNNREHVEIVLAIIVTMKYEDFSIDDFMRVFKLFVFHNFGCTPNYISLLAAGDRSYEVVRDIEVAAFLVGVEKFW